MVEIVRLRWPLDEATVRELEESAVDYLRRSQEELTVEEELSLLWEAVAGHRHDLLLLAARDGDRLLGWCVLAAKAGTMASGPEVLVWQLYVFPGRARLRDLVKAAMPYIEAYARGLGASRLVMHTRRVSRAYLRQLSKDGWSVYGMTLTRPVEGGERVGNPAITVRGPEGGEAPPVRPPTMGGH